MRRWILTITFFLCVSLGLCEHLYAWENITTHPALTEKAVGSDNSAARIDDYLKSQMGLDGGIETELQYDFPFSLRMRMFRADPFITTRSILEWLKTGSVIEDELLVQARSRHHFHDAIRNAGLDNRTEHPDWEGVPTRFSPFDLTGESALVQAIQAHP